jgi:hypothetical protein
MIVPALFLLALPVLWVLYRIVAPTAGFYEYITVNDERRVILVGYVKSDGTIIDVTLPRGQRRVGQVLLKEGRAVVRVYRGNDEERHHEDVGWGDTEGKLWEATNPAEKFFENGLEVAAISPVGKRKWFELWLRCHADVPDADPDPFGKCIEAIRLRAAKPNTPTRLVRAGAALMLYRRKAEVPDEAARPLPHGKWDIVLPAALIFTLIFFVPGAVQLFDEHYRMFPALGREWSYVLSMLFLYMCIWIALFFVKDGMLSNSNEARAFLTLVNRQTGLHLWNIAGILLAFSGLLWSYLVDAYIFFPLFAVLLAAFLVIRFYATGEAWRVEPRNRRPPQKDDGEDEVEPAGPEVIERQYFWELDSPLRRLELSTTLTFGTREVEETRRSNPFQQNQPDAWRRSRAVSLKLVTEGEQARQVRRLVRFIIEESSKAKLSPFEEVQVALDFVQQPNIDYKRDDECEEIGNPPEYFRLPAETLYDKRGDCDCKSILAAALMRSLGYPVLLLISDDTEHAAVAVGGLLDLGEAGDAFTISYKGESYYFCETTGDLWKVGQETELAQRMRRDPQCIVDLGGDLPTGRGLKS